MATSEIEVPVWVRRGGMIIRRDTLEFDDPDHTYNYIKDALGLKPEDYGVCLPEGWTGKRCPHCGELL